MEDVRKTALEIEDQLQQRRTLRGFVRIRPFLTGIEQYSGVVEVLCQGTPYLPFLWAPIKLFLQVTMILIVASQIHYFSSPLISRLLRSYGNDLMENITTDSAESYCGSRESNRCLRDDRRGDAAL